jgi:hypothetical protein
MSETITEARIAEIRVDLLNRVEINNDAGEDLLAALDAANVWHDKARAFLTQRNDFEARALAAEAERDRMREEREQLALAICGGEDAPGYANAQTVATLVGNAERSRREAREEYERAAGDRADAAAARKQVRRYRDALYRIAGGTNYADDPWDIARFALREDLA